MPDMLEPLHRSILRALAARPHGQAHGILECVPETGDCSIFDFMSALSSLTVTGHIDELDELAASATGRARFSISAKGRQALEQQSQIQRECEDLLERYGRGMSCAVFGFGKTAEVFSNAKRTELESMHGRYWMSDGEQRFMLRWAVEAVEARNKRRNNQSAGKNERSGLSDGPDLDAKRRAENDDQRRNVLYPVDAG